MIKNDLVTRNMGIIVTLVARYWCLLPRHVITHYGMDDMVQDAVLHVCIKAYKYQRGKAKSSTFVWTVTRNYCLDILSSYNLAKRKAVLVPLEQTEWKRIQDPSQSLRFREACNAVEQMIRYSGDDVRAALSILFEPDRLQKKQTLTPMVPVLRQAARVYGVTAGDLRIILAAL